MIKLREMGGGAHIEGKRLPGALAVGGRIILKSILKN
jgi:hypothetical protein